MIQTDNSKEKLKNLLEYLTKDWYQDMILSKETNVVLFPRGLDKIGETISSILLNKKGLGSGGMGFDLVDGTEIKTACLIQPKKCSKCSAKNVHFVEKCFQCGSEKFEMLHDSRFGINAKMHVDERGHIPRYVLILIESTDLDENEFINLKEEVKIRVRGWCINPKNKYFDELAQGQFESEKSNAINFMPLHYDFYMSGPIKIFDVEITLGGNNKSPKVNITYFNLKNDLSEQLPCNLLKKEELLEVARKNKVYVNGDESIKNIIEKLSSQKICEINVNDYSFGIRKKTYGKERGKLTRKRY